MTARKKDFSEEPPYPRGEIPWIRYQNAKGELKFLLTSKEARDWYFLYCYVDGKFEKLGKAHTPPELEKKFNVIKEMKK